MDIKVIIIVFIIIWIVFWLFVVAPNKKRKDQVLMISKDEEIKSLRVHWKNGDIQPYEYMWKMKRLSHLSDNEKEEIVKRMEEVIFDFYILGKNPNEKTLKEWNEIYNNTNSQPYITKTYLKGINTWREDFQSIINKRDGLSVSALVDFKSNSESLFNAFDDALNEAIERRTINDRQ